MTVAEVEEGQAWEGSGVNCALWYWRYRSLKVRTFASEMDAVTDALSMQDAETGAPEGIQFSDGHYVDLGNWTAFREEEERQTAVWRAEFRASPPPRQPPTREVTPPFDARGHTAVVSVDAPLWLGRHEAGVDE